MHLLLTHGYFLNEDPKELQIMKPYAPLGILYLSSHLRRKGFDVEIYDSTFGSRRELYEVLDNEEPSVIGIYGTLMTRRAVVEIAEAAKDRGWVVVAGGPEPATYAAEYLAAGADIVVEGEGEQTLEEILHLCRSGGRQALCVSGENALAKVKGIHCLSNSGTPLYTGPRELIADLDGQPWPDRERVAIEKYLQVWRDHHGKGSVSVITARGCPYHCNWCSHSTYGKTHRRRSAANVADEIEWILGRYHPNMLWMADDVFTIRHGWIHEYAKQLRERGIHIPFECITRADRLNAAVADALAELGCFRVWIGSESGSQRILDAMERGVTVEQVRDAVELCRARGIETGMFLMWGYEGEELADIEATVAHVRNCNPNVFLTTVSYPIKGTPYFEQVAGRLVNGGDWRSKTDRDWKVRGRHSRRYYQFADRLLRSEVQLQRAREERRGAADSALIHEMQGQIAEARRELAEAAHEVEA
jgi:radical SAM superfamily enzyme YgiQ (UPF0313 family)